MSAELWKSYIVRRLRLLPFRRFPYGHHGGAGFHQQQQHYGGYGGHGSLDQHGLVGHHHHDEAADSGFHHGGDYVLHHRQKRQIQKGFLADDGYAYEEEFGNDYGGYQQTYGHQHHHGIIQFNLILLKNVILFILESKAKIRRKRSTFFFDLTQYSHSVSNRFFII